MTPENFIFTDRESLRRALVTPPYGGLVTVPYLIGIIRSLEKHIVELSDTLINLNVADRLKAREAAERAEKTRRRLAIKEERARRPLLTAVDYPLPIVGGSDGVRGGYVYFLDGGDVVKIGWSINPANRICELQTAHGSPLKLVAFFHGASIAAERETHARFKRYRRNGEWFQWSDAIYAHVLELRGEKASVL